MFWCISTLPFDLRAPTRKNRHTRRRPIISAPIPQLSGSMHLRRPSTFENTHGNTRVVPDNPAHGKSNVRRRPPPPITATLDEIIDSDIPNAATPTRNSANGKRPVLAIETTTPPADPNDASTVRTMTPRPRFDPMKALRNSFRGRPTEDDAPSLNGHRWKGKERESVVEGEDAQEARDSKFASKAREIREWMKGRSGSDIQIQRLGTYDDRKLEKGETSYVTRTRQNSGGVRDLFKNRRPALPPGDRGPKAGQSYEIINRRIIEKNPDKTVEISTWRENSATARKAVDEDRMSIYYINADEYAQEENDGEGLKRPPKVDWMIDDSDISQGGIEEDVKEGGVLPRRKIPAGVKSPQMEKRPSSRQRHSLSRSEGRRHGTISPSTSEKEPESSSLMTSGLVGGSKLTEPLSSTPVEQQSRRQQRYRGRYKDSKLSEKELPKTPFHPTQSGSTISSIKSESTIDFEAILESCEPSLLHIAPILKSLGIRRIEHLRAVAKLTPRTRDREVKEDALRLGITVVEWAMWKFGV